MTTDSEGRQADPDLAATLRRLRKAAGLSGERLAVRCAMSQSKISRIESGKVLPTALDVERMLTALDVPADVARELISIARRANVEHVSWRAMAETGLWRKQIELKALAESCTTQRLFLPAIPSGLLQIPDYARAAVTPVVTSSPGTNVEKALQGRLEQQTVLNDGSRRFLFVLTEQAVRWRRAGREIMARQCAHMAELTMRPTIDLAIIPQSAEIPGAAFNTFVIYDDRFVVAELFSGEMVLRDPRDVQHHRNLFEFFRERALTGERARAFLLAVRDDFM
ncbi:helix-turn-helix domain-containing protein [Amycolatopsis sp. cg5]|uniref:helix-turn-helix domain-containing protein n=1 Tax=Amycolatopsis sp. cg5 TaxID=3238802 RepID=UPI00352412AD